MAKVAERCRPSPTPMSQRRSWAGTAGSATPAASPLQELQMATKAIEDYLAALSSESSDAEDGETEANTSASAWRHREHRSYPRHQLMYASRAAPMNAPITAAAAAAAEESQEGEGDATTTASLHERLAALSKSYHSDAAASSREAWDRRHPAAAQRSTPPPPPHYFSASASRSTRRSSSAAASRHVGCEEDEDEDEDDEPAAAGRAAPPAAAGSSSSQLVGVQRVRIAAPSPLAVALAAQWDAAQRCWDATHAARDADHPPEQLALTGERQRTAVEAEVLATLRRLPDEVGDLMHLASDARAAGRVLLGLVAELMPHLVAFAATPLPSRRTQSASLAAVDAFLALAQQRLSPSPSPSCSRRVARRVGPSTSPGIQPGGPLSTQDVVDAVFLDDRSDALEAFGFALANTSREVVERHGRSTTSTSSSSPCPSLCVSVLSQLLELVHVACGASAAVRGAMARSGALAGLHEALEALLWVFPSVVASPTAAQVPGREEQGGAARQPKRGGRKERNTSRDLSAAPAAAAHDAVLALHVECLQHIAGLLLVLLDDPGTDAAALLVAGLGGEADGGAHADGGVAALCGAALQLVQALIARLPGGMEVSAAEGGVALLCRYTQLLARLTEEVTPAFHWAMRSLSRDAAGSTALFETFSWLWASQWADVLRWGANWWVALARRATQRGIPARADREGWDALRPTAVTEELDLDTAAQKRLLLSELLLHCLEKPFGGRLTERLREALSWGLEDPAALAPHAAAAARCLRWMVVACPAVATEVISAQPDLFMSIVQLLLASKAQRGAESATAPLSLWRFEMALTAALTFVTGSTQTRQRLRRLVGGTALNEATRQELHRRLEHLLLEGVPGAVLAELAAAGLQPTWRSAPDPSSSATAGESSRVSYRSVKAWRHLLVASLPELLLRSATPNARQTENTAVVEVRGRAHPQPPFVLHSNSASSHRSSLWWSSYSNPAAAAAGPCNESKDTALSVAWSEGGVTPTAAAPTSSGIASARQWRPRPPRPSSSSWPQELASRYAAVARGLRIRGQFVSQSVVTLLRLAHHCSVRFTASPGGSEAGNGQENAPSSASAAALRRAAAAGGFSTSPALSSDFPFHIQSTEGGGGAGGEGAAGGRGSTPTPNTAADVSTASWRTSNTPARDVTSAATAGSSPLPRPPAWGLRSGSVAVAAAHNPWAPVQKRHQGRQWRVEALRREDVLLFYLPVGPQLEKELEEALAATRAHVQHLLEQRRMCPASQVERRCVLQDLYVNMYPKVYAALRHIQARAVAASPDFSPSVRQLLERGDAALHSGNLLELLDAAVHCHPTPGPM